MIADNEVHAPKLPFLAHPRVTTARPTGPSETALALKAALDTFLATLLLLPAAPVILLLMLLVRLTSRGPAFYSQTRLGLNGRPYRIYKIRTMYHNCEKVSGALWSTAG